MIITEIFTKDADGPTTIDKGSIDNKIKKILFSIIDINYNLHLFF